MSIPTYKFAITGFSYDWMLFASLESRSNIVCNLMKIKCKIYKFNGRIGLYKNGKTAGKRLFRPVIRNTTRWNSSFAMLNRVFEVEQFIDRTDMDLAIYLPSPTENLLLKNVSEIMQNLEPISKNLQNEKTTIAVCRILFDHNLDLQCWLGTLSWNWF